MGGRCLLIKVEPAGFLMYTVQIVFDVERPDAEDQPVRDYLAEYGLEPRYQWYAEDDGRKCQWLQFGGCYLGKHLQELGQLQRHAVEVEVLTEEIARCLESISGGVESLVESLSEGERQQVVPALVREFHQESTFHINRNGELAAILDPVEVSRSLWRSLS